MLFSTYGRAIRRLLDYDLIGVNLGWLTGADMPGRHAKDTFAMDFDVTSFGSCSQIGAERLHGNFGDVGIFLRVWIVGIQYLYFIAEHFSVG